MFYFRKAIILAVISLLHGNLWGQSLQEVEVVEYQGANAKTPISAVVLSVYNAPSVASDDGGHLTLQFRTLHDGDKVSLRRVEKDGYEIFNQNAVDQWTVSSIKPFRLVVCQSDHIRQLREQYMQQASASYQHQLKLEQEKLSQLRQQTKLQEEEYQQQLADLEDQYNQQLDNLDTYVDRFARIDLESLNEEQRNIISMVQQGRFDEAIAAYESGHFLDRYQHESQDIARIDAALSTLQSTLEQKRQSQQQILEAIDRQVTLYELAGGRENWGKSYQLRKGVTDADTTNVYQLEDFIQYLILQNHMSEAFDYSYILLRHLPEYTLETLNAYGRLCSLLLNEERMEEAFPCLDKTVEIGRVLVKENCDSHNLYAFIQSLSYSAHVYSTSGVDFEKAEKLADEVDPWLQKYAELAPDEHDNYIGFCIDLKQVKARCLAFHDSKPQEAIQLCKEMIQMARPYQESTDITMATLLPEALSNVFNIAIQCDSSEYALCIANELYKLSSDAYQKNPEGALKDMFFSTLSMCYAEGNLEHWESVLKFAAECETYLKEWETLAGCVMPESHLDIFNLKANAYDEMGDLAQAKQFARMALDYYEQLDEVIKTDYEDEAEALREILKK